MKSKLDTVISDELGKIGNILGNITGMNKLRHSLNDIGGRIIAADDDYMFIKCADITEAFRRIRGKDADCIIETVDNDVIFLKGYK